jgi:hypothetical protein
MSSTKRFLVVMAGTLLAAMPAHAVVLGGGPARTDCFAAWQVTSPDVAANRGPTGVDCEDGDPACDVDGRTDGVCSFGVSFCAGAVSDACTPDAVTAVKLSKRAAQAGVTAPVLPASGTCGPATIVPMAVGNGPRGQRPSRTFVLSATATTASGRDRDVVRLRCVPNRGAGQCPANPDGGPREVEMVVAASGTDLDNGVTGISHNFPVPAAATLRMCVTGCDPATNPTCVQDEAATDAVQADTFGPPLPLLAAGIPTCIVNRFATPSITGGTADLSTGETSGQLHLSSDVYLTDVTQVCPVCSGRGVGETGTCNSGRNAGRACRTDALMDIVSNGNTRRLAVSADCTPSGSPAGTLQLTLPLTTGTSSTSIAACGSVSTGSCGAGTCSAACTGNACVATTPDGKCVDVKGGVSQMCCSNNTQMACFPNGSDAIVRTGDTTVPQPAWPETTYPKSGDATLVATFCEGATGTAAVDIATGLPGPGALILPVTQSFLP